MAVDLERLWSVPAAEPVQPRLLDAMTGLDEKLLRLYRRSPSRGLGRRIRVQLASVLDDGQALSLPVSAYQMARVVGIALWELEHERVADRIGI